jgi:uracil-DNA glycosylase
MSSLTRLLGEIGACRICEAHLPFGDRPIVRLTRTARLLVISQAPGSKVHQTGIPWNDSSGDRLRDWLNLDQRSFYEADSVALMPMGFCYPGASGHSGDKPPRSECAPSWHERVLRQLPALQLTLLVGQYAQRYYLRSDCRGSMTETVKAFSQFGPNLFPLPHPSWRSTIWMRRHPWFEEAVIPTLRKKVRKAISDRSSKTRTNLTDVQLEVG